MDDRAGQLFVLTNKNAINSKLLRLDLKTKKAGCSVMSHLFDMLRKRTANPCFVFLQATEVLPHRDNVKLEDLTLYNKHMAVTERYDGVSHVRVFEFEVRNNVRGTYYQRTALCCRATCCAVLFASSTTNVLYSRTKQVQPSSPATLCLSMRSRTPCGSALQRCVLAACTHYQWLKIAAVLCVAVRLLFLAPWHLRSFSFSPVQLHSSPFWLL